MFLFDHRCLHHLPTATPAYVVLYTGSRNKAGLHVDCAQWMERGLGPKHGWDGRWAGFQEDSASIRKGCLGVRSCVQTVVGNGGWEASHPLGSELVQLWALPGCLDPWFLVGSSRSSTTESLSSLRRGLHHWRRPQSLGGGKERNNFFKVYF